MNLRLRLLTPNAVAGAGGGRQSPESLGDAVDYSCRGPVIVMFYMAVAWMVLAALSGLLASLKLHAPYLLAECQWMTYGRIQPLGMNLLVYGFGIQAGLAVMLWLTARLSAAPLSQAGLALVAALFWNLGVAVGGLGILSGRATGFFLLDMPGAAAPILLASYAAMGTVLLATLARRSTQSLYPSLWFILAALFWFPWIYATAQALVVFWPARGVLQSAVAGWYAGNLITVWFGCVGIASALYLIPAETRRPLHSKHLANFGFWVLLLFGSWAGLSGGGPYPAWMPALSAAGGLLALLGIGAILLNLRMTLRDGAKRGEWEMPPILIIPTGICFGMAGYLLVSAALNGGSAFAASAKVLLAIPGFLLGYAILRSILGDTRVKNNRVLLLALAGAAGLGIAGVLGALNFFKHYADTTQFSWFVSAATQVWLIGFFALSMFAAIYHIVPRVLGTEIFASGLARVHVNLVLGGVIIQCASLLMAAAIQGAALQDPAIPFLETHRLSLRGFRLSTFGDLMILCGVICLGWNFKFGLWRLMKAPLFRTLLDLSAAIPVKSGGKS